MVIDATNKVSHHLGIIIFSALFILIIGNLENYSRAVGALPFILLFFVMIIGPLMTIWPSLYQKLPGNFPYTWRAELGIWFVVWSIAHVLFVFHHRDWQVVDYLVGMSPWALGAFIAILIAIPLALTSCKRAIEFLGVDSWKWLQNFTYVIFWLTAIHVLDRALLRPGFPSDDWLHWVYLIMFALVPILQAAGFVKTVKDNKKEE